MQNHIPKIRALHSVLIRELFTIHASWDYSRITQAVDLLARLVHDCPENPDTGDNSQLWAIGESDYADIGSLIVGAYWHYAEWHNGQWSPEYRALCALGNVFSPGMTRGPEPGTSERDAYLALDRIARKANNMPVYRFELAIAK